MLIQGGMISSGRWWTCSVVGAYWISCISSFWKTTLPGREREVLAEREGVEIGHLDRELAVAAGQVAEQVVEAAQQVLAAALERGAQHLGIGRDEVGGRHRVDELAGVEVDLLPGLVVDALDLVDRVDQPARGQAGTTA